MTPGCSQSYIVTYICAYVLGIYMYIFWSIEQFRKGVILVENRPPIRIFKDTLEDAEHRMNAYVLNNIHSSVFTPFKGCYGKVATLGSSCHSGDLFEFEVWGFKYIHKGFNQLHEPKSFFLIFPYLSVSFLIVRSSFGFNQFKQKIIVKSILQG